MKAHLHTEASQVISVYNNRTNITVQTTNYHELCCYCCDICLINFFYISVTMPHFPLLKGSELLINQLIAMFMKKALYVWRTWYITLIQIIMPPIFLILTIIIVKTWQTIPDLPPLKIDMKVSYTATY
jgi:hypothetical protein